MTARTPLNFRSFSVCEPMYGWVRLKQRAASMISSGIMDDHRKKRYITVLVLDKQYRQLYITGYFTRFQFIGYLHGDFTGFGFGQSFRWYEYRLTYPRPVLLLCRRDFCAGVYRFRDACRPAWCRVGDHPDVRVEFDPPICSERARFQ